MEVHRVVKRLGSKTSRMMVEHDLPNPVTMEEQAEGLQTQSTQINAMLRKCLVALDTQIYIIAYY